jgi:phospholipid/cholesterol/gamma-HCH transport system permease protein
MRNLPAPARVGAPATVRIERGGKTIRIIAEGEWISQEAAKLDPEMRAITHDGMSAAEIDGSRISKLDSTGMWLLLRAKYALEEQGVKVSAFRVPDVYAPLLATIEGDRPVEADEYVPHGRYELVNMVERTGRGTVRALRQGYDLLGFLGRVAVETLEAVLAPRRELPLPALVHQIQETGVTALPIVGLLAFLLGIVLAYQGADQLKRFNAEIYTIDFLGVGFLRELGVLITAIIVAGRSGSAFTAQIGTMRVNEEIDAMQTLGINVTETLVVPRILGLMIALPLLTFFADIVGLIGGMVMTYFDLGITIPAFMRELTTSVSFNTMAVGLIKAPVFAFVIGLVGCFEGLRVERNAASVGQLTTRSVVEAIFLVIACDAGFSILFSKLGI